jgi:hypothetical protein
MKLKTRKIRSVLVPAFFFAALSVFAQKSQPAPPAAASAEDLAKATQNPVADLLLESPRSFERTEIVVLAVPEPCAERVVSCAEDLCTASGEERSFPICARTVQDERCLSLVELACDTGICRAGR